MNVCFYFQLHQPYRLRRYRVFDIGSRTSYFDDETNRRILNRVVDRCYLPATQALHRLIDRAGARFALGISSVLMEQLEAVRPDALQALQRLVATGGIEMVAETSHHSLAALAEDDEFAQQVKLHAVALHKTFGATPRTFRNTEMLVDDALLARIAHMGFATVLVEGAEHVLSGRAPNHVYTSKAAPKLRLLPRNYRLSDDIAFRFTDRRWDGWPLTADTYASWIAGSPGDMVNLFMDFETFGEHHEAKSGILDFLLALPAALERHGVHLVTPTDASAKKPGGALSFPTPTSWADSERDDSAWLGNKIQRAAHHRLYALRSAVTASKSRALMTDWRRLTTSDHFYYMSTKWRADGDVHTYFNPHASPYDAYISFMNVARDLAQRLTVTPQPTPKRKNPIAKQPTAKVKKPTTKRQHPRGKRPARSAGKRDPKSRTR